MRRNRLSITPKTRATTSSGAARCSRVMPETSTIVLPMPTIASSTSANTWFGQIATNAIGTPQMKMPRPKSAASRRLPTRAAAATAPSRPPMPTAELRKPTPAFPVSRSFSAITTIRTFNIPSTNVCAENSPTSRRRRRSRAMMRKPANSSSAIELASGVSPFSTSASGWMPATRIADQTSAAAVTMKTAPGPDAASSRPPIAGPPKIPMLSIALADTFAAVSSSGVRTSDGTSAACAGPERRRRDPDEAGDDVDQRAAPRLRRRPPPRAPMRAARTRSEATMTTLRS